jgi:lysophospholipase L1-like esterase
MAVSETGTYLQEIGAVLRTHWPANRLVNIVCHGHSVPAGYFATPVVDTFNAYPHLLHAALKHRCPFAVLNVIVTAIGGENSASGSARFGAEVLCHRPDVVTIDYGLNDRGIGLAAALDNWTTMIEQALQQNAKLILLTPTPDLTQLATAAVEDRRILQDHAAQIRELAAHYEVGLADSLAAFAAYQDGGGDLTDLLSWSNHPNRSGHEMVARELLRWFPAA